MELTKHGQYYLGKKCKIGIAECIINNSENKYIYRMCQIMKETLVDRANAYDGVNVIYEETYSIKNIKSFIEKNRDIDILYISAYGYYDRKLNMAGIMVGDEFWMADDDIIVPPIVILSSCYTSPRGIGTVNIGTCLLEMEH